ncbi:MAG: DNA mismatch repair endonuclease MutL [Oscillospiraceae bacterium]|nr:DNA mismatch repair endonuclease MutL [Oscillospiraceae bacterium]
MPHIAQLSPHVADLIAAGEVVERPASVVKELTENAIDAGARSVTVEIQNGGMTLIRVTDDGCGIAPEEVQTAFLRHATSKIKTEYDLEAIGTLGFRGEALAAIASVSRLEVLTRRPEDDLGTSLALEGGVVLGQEEAGCPVGTTLLVRDLFYNTPARLKFMKKDAAEGAACLASLQRQALAHPEVAFKLIRDGRQELLTPGDGKLHSALYAVLGRELALGFVPVEGSGEDVSVSGFVSLPTCCRGTRGYQFFFVNGRYVKSKSITAAVEQAYANQRMVGKFPGCVLHLTVKLNQVDVNVHPTKQEVKFGSERQVFSAVYYAVLSALGVDKTRPAAEGAVRPMVVEQGRQTSLPLQDFTAPPSPVKGEAPPPPKVIPKGEPTVRRMAEAARSALAEEAVSPPRSVPTPSPVERIAPSTLSAPKEPPSPAGRDLPEAPGPACSGHAAPVVPPPAVKEGSASTEDNTLPASVLTEELREPWRIAGELFHTYILVEQGEKALLIDKHAAHERMNFDRMRQEDYAPMSQLLLAPVIFTPIPEEGALLLEHLEELDRVGFQVEDFGGGSLAVRSVPDYLEVGDIEAALTEIAGKLALSGVTGTGERRDEILHTMACKAAIKGGWTSAPEELERVARAVLSGQVKYCPHGRPVAVELTRAELEKQFKRRT